MSNGKEEIGEMFANAIHAIFIFAHISAWMVILTLPLAIWKIIDIIIWISRIAWC